VAAQQHTSDAQILDRRTLARDHRRLAALLRPGMRVLDVGCGTGAITSGIARVVGPSGLAVGIDRDPGLLRLARQQHANVASLRFEERDVFDLRPDPVFDIVTAARVLQWTEQPGLAVARMAAATRPGGRVVVLEYSHADLVWQPEPPPPVRRFYDGFLSWRSAHGWDNRLADGLPRLLEDAGLVDVRASVEDEVAVRGESGFDDALALWRRVMEGMGPTMVQAGALSAAELADALVTHGSWCVGAARVQRMVLRAADGRRDGLLESWRNALTDGKRRV
jgi:SAM-dependent methyltransferase